jgi:hypothetical protein
MATGQARLTAADLASLRAVQAIQQGQLRELRKALVACAPETRDKPAFITARGCLRAPVNHAVINGRMNGGLMSSLANKMLPGACYRQLLSSANGMRFLAMTASNVSRSWFDISPTGRRDALNGVVALAQETTALQQSTRVNPKICQKSQRPPATSRTGTL